MRSQMKNNSIGRRAPRARQLPFVRALPSVSASTRVVVKETGVATFQGTVRKVNEDRWDTQVGISTGPGEIQSFAGVYDGHGGGATADWLKKSFFGYVKKHWRAGTQIKDAITEAHLQADKALLGSKSGFMGLGERGVGGAKCGATSATVMLYESNGTTKLVSANIGDARTLLIKSNGKAYVPQQLTFDHVPDESVERDRIEKYNPNPKMPLVRYIAGTWRVGGLLALSRAFGDAYLKGSLQFEGIAEGSDGYSSGFGVISEPTIETVDLSVDDKWVVISSDGLYNEETRGGGGGLDNEQVADILKSAGPNADCNKVAETLALAAMEMGSTDDITVVLLKLGTQ